MERDLVEVVVNKMVFTVNRGELAKEMKQWGDVARYLGKRPGEPTDDFLPTERHSADRMAVMTTILYCKRN